MKKKIIVMLLLIFIVSLMCVSVYGARIETTDAEGNTVFINDFYDTKNHWAHDTILRCADYGIINGYNGNFMPNNPIKRGDLAIIFDRMLGLKTLSYNTFYDLPNDAYYRDSLLKSVAAGYITGTGANTISPDGYATREQVAVIICRIFNIKTTAGYTNFVDDAQISSWAKPSVSAVKRLGYMVGNNYNYFNPQSNITRGELVTLINNIANTYIPKQDTVELGETFKNDYPTNLVTGRDITLNNSTVGRDIVLTYASSSLTLNNTEVLGRILVMGRNSLTLRNSKVSQIYLNDGKTEVIGINDGISEVYVAQYATESTLDNYPNKLVLEPGVRVSIKDNMYENTTNRTKTYYGQELKADVAEEQGYIIGGPQIRGSVFSQSHDNNIKVSNVQISVGDSTISEVGVVWLKQTSNEDTILPTYKNCDDKKIYKSNKIGEPISFDVGTVKGTYAYRVYVRDSKGLFAYGDATVFTAYDFTTTMNIYNKDYPRTLDVEVVLKGKNVPDVNSIRCVYDVDELYSETHSEASMSLYTERDAERPIDPKTYKRYITTITSDRKTIGSEEVITPPTNFGYIITFRNEEVINTFPVLRNKVPAGVSPMSELVTGSASYDSKNNIVIKNNKIGTRYVIPQEVGIVYKVSNSTSVSRPTVEANGWTRITSGVSVGVNDYTYFNSSIEVKSNEGNTFYAVYVKTSNGYWYGDVKSISNDMKKDEDGYFIESIDTYVLGDGEVLLGIKVDSPIFKEYTSIALGDELGIASLNASKLEFTYSYDNTFYIVLRGLNKNKEYELPIRLYKQNGSKSNVFTVSFKTFAPYTVANKHTVGEETVFNLKSVENIQYKPSLSFINFLNSSEEIQINNRDTMEFSIDKSVDLVNKEVEVQIDYQIARSSQYNVSYRFSVTLSLY